MPRRCLGGWLAGAGLVQERELQEGLTGVVCCLLKPVLLKLFWTCVLCCFNGNCASYMCNEIL
jgi:hypothetical protein